MMVATDTKTSSLKSAIDSEKAYRERDIAVESVRPTKPSNGLQMKIDNWLKSVGLDVNPFSPSLFDASQDPFIPFYLIDHNEYESINGDFTSLIFAAPGSGKSAFRVRLTRDCRVNRDQRKIFPIVYNLPSPDIVPIPLDLHYRMLAKSAAFELMLYLVYHSPSIINDGELLSSFQRVFDLNLGVNHIQQMAEWGNTQPLLDSFDLTARLLPNPPGKKNLLKLAARLNTAKHAAFSLPQVSSKQKFDDIASLIFEELGYEAIYILVDGVDGYPETARKEENSVGAISWLLRQTSKWQQNRIFVKYFLPEDMKKALEHRFPVLTSESKVTMIKWNADTLSEVIRQRLQEASGGKYNSLRAISSLPLRGTKLAPEEVLAQEIAKLDNPTPRDLIQAVHRLLIHHAQYDEQEKLTPKDMQAALNWIHSHKAVRQIA